MKVIFSRKGFDAQFGGQPSPILPDGTLLSLPIPRENDIVTYSDLFFNNQSYFNIISELNPNTKLTAQTTCHLDPDIRKNIRSPHPENRPSIFGQCDAALTLLKKWDVKKDDIFLFFGWFRQAEFNEVGRLVYKLKSPDLHLIYGYLQVGEIYQCSNGSPDCVKHHAHLNGNFVEKKNNNIYVTRDTFSLNEKFKGSGCFKYSENLVLTAEGMSRSKWKPHSFFYELPMTYHSKNSFKESYFQSAAQGQEFIMSSSEELQNWVIKLIMENRENDDIF